MKINAVWHLLQVSALDLQDYLRSIALDLRKSKAIGEMSKQFVYDEDARAALSELQSNQDLEWYRTKLRSKPYWARGHLKVGEICLALNDIASAYCAALAVTKLLNKGNLLLTANHLLGKIYLRSGSYEQAREILEKVKLKVPNKSDLLEDLAAAYLGLSKFESAYAILSTIGQEKLSLEGLAAYQYLKQKIN